MKKFASIIIALLLMVSLSACSSITPTMLKTDVKLTVSDDGYLIYNGTKTRVSISGLKGNDGIDGINGTNGIDGKDGVNGVNGKDGLTPFIGANGNWWIGTTDTNVKASGGLSDFVYKSITLNNELMGAVQKGPFISGTSINFYELDQTFQQTGFSYNTRTTDNIGSFSLRKGLKLSSNNLLFVAQGFYFNEVLGKNSEVPLTLYLVSDISDQTKVNINLLTTLEQERIMYLVDNGMTYSTATTQARQEILNMFYINKVNMDDAQNLDITKPGDDNAILLAISIILQGYRSTSELSLLLAEIGNDIKADGILNNDRLKSELINGAKLLHYSQIRSNLEKFYSQNNITVNVPNFEFYINQFIDMNAASSNPYVFTKNIEYPKDGKLGLNLLDKSLTNVFVRSGNASFNAYIPAGASVKIVITRIGIDLSAWGWEIDMPSLDLGFFMYLSGMTYSDRLLEGGYMFEGITSLLPGDEMYKIDYYENGSETPTFSKIIVFDGMDLQ